MPSINSLKEEYAKLEAEKRKLYSVNKPVREDMIALKTAKQNVDTFFAEPRQPQQQERKKSHDHSR